MVSSKQTPSQPTRRLKLLYLRSAIVTEVEFSYIFSCEVVRILNQRLGFVRLPERLSKSQGNFGFLLRAWLSQIRGTQTELPWTAWLQAKCRSPESGWQA